MAQRNSQQGAARGGPVMLHPVRVTPCYSLFGRVITVWFKSVPDLQLFRAKRVLTVWNFCVQICLVSFNSIFS